MREEVSQSVSFMLQCCSSIYTAASLMYGRQHKNYPVFCFITVELLFISH